MTNDHVADAGHPRKTAFLQWVTGAVPMVLPKPQVIYRRLAAPVLAGTLTAFAAPPPTSKDGAAIRRVKEPTLGSAKQGRPPSASGDSSINPATGGDPAETPSQRPSVTDVQRFPIPSLATVANGAGNHIARPQYRGPDHGRRCLKALCGNQSMEMRIGEQPR